MRQRDAAGLGILHAIVMSLFRPQTYTRRPVVGDYILGRTGVSWSVNRSLGDGTVARLTEGEPHKNAARDAVVGAASADATDAWEMAGAGEFRLLASYRPQSLR
jgi:hypothetical protein